MCKMSKSAIYTNNSTAQTLAVGETIALGNVIRRFGCNLGISAFGITLMGNGYYKVDANIVALPTAAGTVTAQLYVDGMAVTGASATAETTAATQEVTLPISALIRVQNCCNRDSALSIVLSGAAGVVSNVSVVVEKL